MVKPDLIYKYFPNLSVNQKIKIEGLFDIYEHWNAQINVISRKDMDNFYERHVLHSLGIAVVKPFKANQSVIDIGTGGGFPGVPLAILFPQTSFILCDSIGKKITVVNEVCKALDIQNVQTFHSRSEDLKLQCDAMVSRAVTQLTPFYQMTKHLLKPENDGLHYLKGGDLKAELKEFKGKFKKKKVKQAKLSAYFKEEFFESKMVISVY